MINYQEKTVTLAGKTEPIREFAVWFRTAGGLFSSYDEVLAHCAMLDLDVRVSIYPVAVVLGEGGLYEEVPR